jgi:2'-5' RNA ligase
MPDKIRSFLAIELTEGLRRSLAALQRRIDSPEIDVRWVRPENIHLTLRFLGEVSEEELERISRTARNAAEKAVPFRVVLGGLGAFPTARSPRVVWVGVEDPEPLVSFENELTRELARIDWPPPDKAFRPHLTLARVKSSRGKGRLTRLLEGNRSATVGEIQVEHLALIKSELRPTGPIYTALDRFRFSQRSGKAVS